MIPIREQIISEIQSRLSRLLEQGECLRCEPYADQDEFVALWDIDEENASENYNRTQHDLQLAVVYTLRYRQADYPSKLNAMLAQLEYQIHHNGDGHYDDEINGLADNIECTASAMKYPDAGSPFISVGATYQVRYATRRGDPYSQP